jgi:hypothetical protein
MLLNYCKRDWSGLKLEIFGGYPGCCRGVGVTALREHLSILFCRLKLFSAPPPPLLLKNSGAGFHCCCGQLPEMKRV